MPEVVVVLECRSRERLFDFIPAKPIGNRAGGQCFSSRTVFVLDGI